MAFPQIIWALLNAQGQVQVKSAAAIAALELRPGDDEKKNKILVPVPHPNYNRSIFNKVPGQGWTSSQSLVDVIENSWIANSWIAELIEKPELLE